jgi:hypothetical protein
MCIVIDQGTQFSSCFLPYGPLWYISNIGWVIGSELLWFYEILAFIMLTFFLTRKYSKINILGFTFIAYLVITHQPYLISSVLWLMLGVLNPVFAIIPIFDRLPIFTSWNFSNSGSPFEPTHLIRYLSFGLWYIGNIIYWIRKLKVLTALRKRLYRPS